MSRPKRVNDSRDANFIACFLLFGAMPKGNDAHLYHYKENVREWWRYMHKGQTPEIKEATLYRFWNRYKRWYENMMNNERRTDRAAHHIVKKWIDGT